MSLKRHSRNQAWSKAALVCRAVKFCSRCWLCHVVSQKNGLRFRDLGFQKEKAFQWQYGSETVIVIDLYVSKKLAMPQTLTPEAPKF